MFNSEFNVYNDNSGVIQANINIGPVIAPLKKEQLPFHDQSNLRLLQEEADHFKKLGLLVNPGDIGIDAKYVSPSFIVKKSQWDIVSQLYLMN